MRRLGHGVCRIPVASEGPGIARRGEKGDPTGVRLLDIASPSIETYSGFLFAAAVAHRNNGREILIDSIQSRDQDITGIHVFDRRVRRNGAADFQIEFGLRFVVVAGNPRVGTGQDDLRLVGGKAEEVAISRDIRHGEIGLPNHCDTHAGSRITGAIQRFDVIHQSEIGWTQQSVGGVGNVILRLEPLSMGRLWIEIRQTMNACHHAGQSCRNFQITGICEVNLLTYLESVDFCVKRRGCLAVRATEHDPIAGCGHTVDMKTLRFKPAAHLFDVGVGEAESLGILFRSEPAVIVRGSRILQIREQLLQFLFLLRGRLKQ